MGSVVKRVAGIALIILSLGLILVSLQSSRAASIAFWRQGSETMLHVKSMTPPEWLPVWKGVPQRLFLLTELLFLISGIGFLLLKPWARTFLLFTTFLAILESFVPAIIFFREDYNESQLGVYLVNQCHNLIGDNPYGFLLLLSPPVWIGALLNLIEHCLTGVFNYLTHAWPLFAFYTGILLICFFFPKGESL